MLRSEGHAVAAGRTRTSLAQEVAAALEGQILDERLRTGTRLGRRTDLIDRFGVGSSVINQALELLRERDLVEVKPGPNGGVIVTNPPLQMRLGGIDVWYKGLNVEPEQLFEARLYLDRLFAPVALQRAGAEHVRDMEWAMEDLRACPSDDARAILGSTMRVHLAIARSAQIEVLFGLYQTITATLTATMIDARFTADAAAEGHRKQVELHAAIIAAIRAGDAARLSELLVAHDERAVRVT